MQVTQHGGYVAFESLDGQDLYYTKDQDLWKEPLRGGHESRVVASIIESNFAVAKRGIYFLENAASSESTVRVRFLDFATQAIRTVALVPGPVGLEMSVSPDERFLLFQKDDHEGSELMLVENVP